MNVGRGDVWMKVTEKLADGEDDTLPKRVRGVWISLECNELPWTKGHIIHWMEISVGIEYKMRMIYKMVIIRVCKKVEPLQIRYEHSKVLRTTKLIYTTTLFNILLDARHIWAVGSHGKSRKGDCISGPPMGSIFVKYVLKVKSNISSVEQTQLDYRIDAI